MATIGFIGPGIMGAPMIRNLVQAGHRVQAAGRSEASRENAAQAGATVVDHPHEAAEGVDVLMTMLPDGPAVHSVLLGEGGVLQHLDSSSALIDFSTISPAESREVHAAASTQGIDCLDAPVSGGEPAAIDGTLSIMVGGHPDVFNRVEPLLNVVGGTVVHVGDAGSGQVVKAANQLMVAGHIQMLAEAVVLLKAHDVELSSALDVIGGGLAGSTVLQRKRNNMLQGEYEPGFRIALHDKDLGIVADAAKDLSISLPATGVVTSLVRAARQRGYGRLDHSALHLLLTEFNGGVDEPKTT